MCPKLRVIFFSIGSCLTTSVSHAMNCRISGLQNLNFACSIPNLANCPANATIQLSCSNNTSVTASLSQGNSNLYAQRSLINTLNSHNVISYNIYTAPSLASPIFGDGSAGTSTMSLTCNGSCQVFLYAYLAANTSSNVQAGVYSDTLILTINFN